MENVKDGNDQGVAWLELTDDFYWSSLCKGISFGKPGLTIEEAPDAFSFRDRLQIFTIFDTGTSFTMVPYTYWQGFADTLATVSGLSTYEIEEGYFLYSCEERHLIPDLYFMFDYYWL